MGIQHILEMLLLVCLGVAIIGVPATAEAADQPRDPADIAAGNNAFAVAVYQQMAAESGNLFLCPYSIRTVLFMTFAGARGETADQMARALNIHEPMSDIHRASQAWQTSLNAETKEQAGYELHTANAVWGQQGYAFQADFVEQLMTSYEGGLREVDFAHDPEAARNTINAWVEAGTAGKIMEFLKPKSLDPSVTLVLTNSVYFKGAWEFPFDREKTRQASFTMLPETSGTEESVDVPMMSQTLTTAYGEDDMLQVVELPYVGERLSMLLVVPKQLDGLRRIEKALSPALLTHMFELLQPQKVIVTIPRWSMEFEAALPDALRNLGMTDAFSLPPADFSGMTGGKDLYISAVLHKAVLDVNEEGTEAAAATEVTMSRGLQRHPMFVADRPFLVMIRDRRTDGILFIGRVMDPRD